MSQPIPNVAATVADADTSAAASNVVADADKHTPETPKHEPPAPGVPDPTDGENARDESGDLISALARRVEVLEDAAKQAIKAADPDTPPVKRVPWTKRGGKRKP